MVGMRMVSVVMWLCKIINYSYLWCQTAQCFTYHSSHQDALCTWHDCMKLIQLQMKTPSKYSEGVLLCRTYDILHQQQTRNPHMAFINPQTVSQSITNWFVGCFGAPESTVPFRSIWHTPVTVTHWPSSTLQHWGLWPVTWSTFLTLVSRCRDSLPKVS
jgi:hypothetical protein